MTAVTDATKTLYETVADTSKPGDLSDHAARHEPGNFLRHAASLSMTKAADGLIDPKLVLSWLLQTLGASSFWVGLLVPVREAGALLPQLFTSERIHAMQRRKWAWAAGSAVQGLAAAGIGVAGLTLEGEVAGVIIVALLAVLALARSVCSVSYKDILGKTVGKTRRGTATGFASSVASAAVIVFALTLMLGVADRYVLVVGALLLASGLWLVAATVFSTLKEEASEKKDVSGTLRAALAQMSVLWDDSQLRRFIAARGLLVGTALAPPFIVVMATNAGESSLGNLGALVLASSAASLMSGYVWGRLSDRSSRRVLIYSGVFAGLALCAAIAAEALNFMGTMWAAPGILFGLMLAYHGVRQGRSTHLVDMADEDQRAQYTAVSNTVIGLILLGAGVFGAVASTFGAAWTVGIFAAMSFAGATVAMTLSEVQND